MAVEKTRVMAHPARTDAYKTVRVSGGAARFHEKAGDTFGACVIEAPVGAGEIAAVYKAGRQNGGAARAVKVLKPEYARDPQVKARFMRAASVAARLSHPNIVTIHQAGEKAGAPFIEMEFAEGMPLRQLLSLKGRLPAAVSLSIAELSAEALAYAHRVRVAEAPGQGVVHGGVKPENVMIAPDGAVKVGDFGLAGVIENPGLGAVPYLSAGQLDGKNADVRSDVHGLSVVLYEMLSGTPPYTGATKTAVVRNIASGRYASLRQAAPGVPAPVAEIVRKGLKARPEERFSDALAFARAVKAERERFGGNPAQIILDFLRSGDAGAMAALQARRVPVAAWIIIGALALAGAVLLLFLRLRP